ncbi:MAG: MATE family efflux transporter [Desulfurococcaceae archaeon]
MTITESVAVNREKILTGRVGTTLLWLGLPLMVVQLVNISYNIVDTFWLSRYDEIAPAVPRQIWPTFMFINALTQGLVVANLAIISQYVGAQDYEEAKKVISHFISATLLLNLIATSLYLMVRQYIFLYIIRTPPELFNYVMKYSGVISIDMVLSAFTLTYSTIFQSIGDTRTPSRINIVASLVNFLLDPLMILGLEVNNVVVFPRMGVIGAAIATVIARLTGLMVLVTYLNTKYSSLRPRLTFKFDAKWVLKCLRIGMPVSVMMISNSMAFMLQNSLINQFGVYVATAAAIGFVLMDIADATIWGFTSSVAVMVGQAVGANMPSRAREVAIKSMLYIGCSTLIGSLIVLFARKVFISFFTSNEVIASEAERFVTIFVPTLVFFAIFFIGMSIGRGSGHILFPTMIGIIRLWIIRIMLGYILAFVFKMGVMGVWIAMALSNVISGIAIIPWILRCNWTTPIIRTTEVKWVPRYRKP